MSGIHSQVECVVSMRRVNHPAIHLGPQRAARIIMGGSSVPRQCNGRVERAFEAAKLANPSRVCWLIRHCLA